jgi:acetoin utilization deacetylase AcuC-like enzyme
MRIYTHEACIHHAVPPGHPESPERLTHLLDHLESSGLTRDIPLVETTSVTDADIERVHPAAHIRFLASMQPEEGVVPADPDTWLGPSSLAAARYAAGAVCQATEAVLDGNQLRGFCAVRPPGHHAETTSAMGFCLINSVAIAARRALASGKVERVAILDFDVHHCNGTVEIFKDDPRVLVCSSFQHPFYPNRHFDIERPNIVNTPLAAGTASAEFRQAVDDSWWDPVDEHRPELIFISAGFDAHRLDPLANVNLVEDDFAWITSKICEAADRHAAGRVVSTLEGGYDLDALAASVHAHLTALAD